MDEIFHKTTNVFEVVRLARPSVTPNRYDKNGELIIPYEDTEDHQRRVSLTGAGAGGVAAAKGLPSEKTGVAAGVVQNKERSEHNEAYRVEGGYASASASENEKTSS